MIADNVPLSGLRRLLQQTFDDSEETLNAFFATGFSPDRCCYILENGQPVSALYWFDFLFQEARFAYIYAAATDAAFGGKGYFRHLLEQTHAHLQSDGYAGVLLVPASPALFDLYRKFGYQPISTVSEFDCTAGTNPVDMLQIPADRYAERRKVFLPTGGVVQEGAFLRFLDTQCRFYEGTDFLLAASVEGDTLSVQELLGNRQAAAGVLCTLNLSNGHFRTPGQDRDFAMLLPFRENCPIPSYFGLALD